MRFFLLVRLLSSNANGRLAITETVCFFLFYYCVSGTSNSIHHTSYRVHQPFVPTIDAEQKEMATHDSVARNLEGADSANTFIFIGLRLSHSRINT